MTHQRGNGLVFVFADNPVKQSCGNLQWTFDTDQVGVPREFLG